MVVVGGIVGWYITRDHATVTRYMSGLFTSSYDNKNEKMSNSSDADGMQ